MSILKELGTPAFHAEGYPEINLKTWRLDVVGLVAKPLVLGLNEIKALPSSTVDARLTSVSGWSVRATWTGVLFTDFLDIVKLDEKASYATFASVGGYESTLSMKNLIEPKVMLCYGVGGEPLELDYGGPMRLLVPHLWGYKSVKWLARIEFSDRMKGGYWEDRGYSREAEIETGITFDINTQTKRAIKGDGEVTEF